MRISAIYPGDQTDLCRNPAPVEIAFPHLNSFPINVTHIHLARIKRYVIGLGFIWVARISIEPRCIRRSSSACMHNRVYLIGLLKTCGCAGYAVSLQRRRVTLSSKTTSLTSTAERTLDIPVLATQCDMISVEDVCKEMLHLSKQG